MIHFTENQIKISGTNIQKKKGWDITKNHFKKTNDSESFVFQDFI